MNIIILNKKFEGFILSFPETKLKLSSMQMRTEMIKQSFSISFCREIILQTLFPRLINKTWKDKDVNIQTKAMFFPTVNHSESEDS